MDYVTTNIRFAEEDYMELKMTAAKRRTSIAQIVRERVQTGSNSKKINSEKFIQRLKKFAKENTKYFNGKSAEQMIREMRDEQ